MSKQSPPAPTARAVGPCPTVIKTVGHPGTGSLPSRKEELTDILNTSRDWVNKWSVKRESSLGKLQAHTKLSSNSLKIIQKYQSIKSYSAI